MKLIVDFLYLVAVTAISPMVLYRMVRHKRYRAGWAQKLGDITRKQPGKKCIWIHAVSVGEVNATKTIIAGLKEKFSDFEIVISTTTDTGYARAKALYGSQFTVFYFPYDFSSISRRAFDNIRPAICLLMELEVWPNFVATAKKLNVPVVVVNGRISEKSYSRYRLIKPIVKKIFNDLSLILSQTQLYGQRFQEIGAPQDKIIVTGSLKYDTAVTSGNIDGADKLAEQLSIGNERLFVAGGTGNDEEAIIINVFKQLKQKEQFADLRLAIVPRKPERFDGVAELITQAGFALVRYSQLKEKPPASDIDKNAIILGDTMGDLRKFYSLATIIFVGRTLVPMGGSDMMEAAALGKCTMFGPHAFNFQQTVDALLEGNGAIMVEDADSLLEACRKSLDQPYFARQIAQNGQDVIRKNQGATAKSIEQIAKLLTD
jgi:3-deoxy-D-manno-octulosonic-acid transferase